MAEIEADSLSYVSRCMEALRFGFLRSEALRVLLPLLVARRLVQTGRLAVDVVEQLLTGTPSSELQSERGNRLFECWERLGAAALVKGLPHSELDALVQSFDLLDLSEPVYTSAEADELFVAVAEHLVGQAGGAIPTPSGVAKLVATLGLGLEHREPTTVYDPACGFGSTLFEAAKASEGTKSPAILGQEINSEVAALARLRGLLSPESALVVKEGNTLVSDAFPGVSAEVVLALPPFSMSWKAFRRELEQAESAPHLKGRFAPGLPRESDASLLFVLHCLSKLRPQDAGGGRAVVVTSGNPLWSGKAGSGESEIRRHLFENDLVEAIVALPMGIFPHTRIRTYIWVLSNSKRDKAKGRVRAVDASEIGTRLKANAVRSLRIDEADVCNVSDLVFNGGDPLLVKEIPNTDFISRSLTVEHPLRVTYSFSEDTIAGMERRARTLEHQRATADVVAALRAIGEPGPWNTKGQFREVLAQGFKKAGIPVNERTEHDLMEKCSQPDPAGELVTKNGKPAADPARREHIELQGNVDPSAYFQEHVLPRAPDSWLAEIAVGCSVRRIAHLGFALGRQVARLREEYESCRVVPLRELCVRIERSRTTKGLQKSDSLVENLANLGVAAHVDETRVLPEYLAMFLRTELGRNLLSALTEASPSRLLSPDDLADFPVPVPPLAEQNALLDVRAQLNDLAGMIARVDAELGANPKNIGPVSSAIAPVIRALGKLSDADEVRERLRAGESKHVEFKSTFSLDIKKGTKEKYIEESALKTIVAFLNSDGGDLLLGVDDDGNVLGLQQEITVLHQGSRDKFLLNLKNSLKSRMGEQTYPLLDQRLVELEGKQVVWFACKAADQPVFLDEVSFFVRTNPATDKLEGRKLADYLKARFTS